MSAARDRAATAWGVTPAVVTQPEADAGNRPAHDVVAPDPAPPFGVAWAEFEAASAEELRAALRLDEQHAWAGEISGGVVAYPSSVEHPWVRAVDDGDGEV